MSKLSDRINEDIKAAMLAREKEKLESLRAIKSALLLANTSGEAVTEESEIKLLQKLVKQRRESAAIYQSQNRQDLAEKELFEASVIEKYLPEQMSPEELKAVVTAIVQELGVTDIKGMGKVMAEATKRLAGKADGKTISEVVKQILNS